MVVSLTRHGPNGPATTTTHKLPSTSQTLMPHLPSPSRPLSLAQSRPHSVSSTVLPLIATSTAPHPLPPRCTAPLILALVHRAVAPRYPPPRRRSSPLPLHCTSSSSTVSHHCSLLSCLLHRAAAPRPPPPRHCSSPPPPCLAVLALLRSSVACCRSAP
jgi:hypothetical protein